MNEKMSLDAIGWQAVICGDNNVYPSKIVCVGRNYVDHIQELDNEVPDQMVVFLKPNSAITTTLYSQIDEPLHYETELCFLYQRGRFSAVGIGLDLTKRGLQTRLKNKGLPWERAKAFDGSALFSPFVPIDMISDEFRFELRVNQELVQYGNISLMIHAPHDILREISEFMSLTDGDIVMTGTPKGVGIVPSDALFEVSLTDGDNSIITWHWHSH